MCVGIWQICCNYYYYLQTTKTTLHHYHPPPPLSIYTYFLVHQQQCPLLLLLTFCDMRMREFGKLLLTSAPKYFYTFVLRSIARLYVDFYTLVCTLKCFLLHLWKYFFYLEWFETQNTVTTCKAATFNIMVCWMWQHTCCCVMWAVTPKSKQTNIISASTFSSHFYNLVEEFKKKYQKKKKYSDLLFVMFIIISMYVCISPSNACWYFNFNFLTEYDFSKIACWYVIVYLFDMKTKSV